MFKFRTMAVDSSTRHAEHVRDLIRTGKKLRKLDAELPVTGPGYWLRLTGLDELPQLWNVLRGEMSLVGPRPFLPYEAEEVGAEYARRYEVNPGITGLWQVSDRGEHTFEEMLELDLRYVEQASFGDDLRILAKTPLALLRGLRPSEKSYSAHPKALVEAEDIGENTRIWAYAHILPGAKIGAECNIGDHCFVEGGATLGDGVILKNGVSIWDEVTLGNHVFVGPNAVFTNDRHPRAHPDLKAPRETWLSTVVHDHATIGANATIVCGVEIGPYAVVAAGSTVTQPVKAREMVGGVPARHLGWVCERGHRMQDGECVSCSVLRDL